MIRTSTHPTPSGYPFPGGRSKSLYALFAFLVLIFGQGLVPHVQAAERGTIVTIAGNGNSDFRGDGGPSTQASLSYPEGLTVDRLGNVFVADLNNDRVRKISADWTITTVAGSGPVFTSDNRFDSRGDPPAIQAVGPFATAVDRFYFSGDGGPATGALLALPSDVAFDLAGNLLIADQDNFRIRKVSSDGIITTFAGGGSSSADGVHATSADLGIPAALAVDGRGNLFISNGYGLGPNGGRGNVRRVGPEGIITTVAGALRTGFIGTGIPAITESFNYVDGVAVDAQGNLFIADFGFSGPSLSYPYQTGRISKVDSNGILTSVATGLSGPQAIVLDAGGNLFVADSGNDRILKIPPTGTMEVVAGSNPMIDPKTGKPNPAAGFYGDGGPATQALVAQPGGVAVDRWGNLYIADTDNQRIREVFGVAVPEPGALPLIPGDVNRDGTVNLEDAELALRSVVGDALLAPEQSAAANLTGSGTVGLGDVILILKKAIGL